MVRPAHEALEGAPWHMLCIEAARRCLLGKLLKAIAVGFACTLSFGALADGGPARDLPLLAAQEPLLPVLLGSRPADASQLAQLRAGMGAPLAAHRTGVILWDEPRPGIPPARSASAPSDSASITAAASILRK